MLAALLSLLSSCFAYEMVLEDPFAEAESRILELCPLPIQQEKPSASPFPALEPQIARLFPRELRLQTEPVTDCSSSLAHLQTGQAVEAGPPFLLSGRLKVREVLNTQPSAPLSWQALNTESSLSMTLQLELEIWRKNPVRRLHQIQVSESAHTVASQRSLLIEKLQEKLLQQAILALQPRYRYR